MNGSNLFLILTQPFDVDDVRSLQIRKLKLRKIIDLPKVTHGKG